MPKTTRRDVLRSLPLIALAPTVPGFLGQLARAAAPEREGRVLVVVQLDGGNDGLNTVVPFGDDAYAKNRRALRLKSSELIKVVDGIGLHPALRRAGDLLESGRLAIVPGAGYPNPNRSHFASMAIWQTARLDVDDAGQGRPGWLARDPAASEASAFVGAGPIPAALRGRRATPTSLERLDDLTFDPSLPRPSAEGGTELADFVRRSMLDAYASSDRLAAIARKEPAARYPASAVGERLKLVARLIKGGFAARVYYTAQQGYDTHAAQLGTHYGLLAELAGALKAFLDDLAESRVAERVLVLGFSEFGRRVRENASAGTDHGAAGPVLLAGPGVRAGLVGPYPSLTDLDDGDLKPTVDFRRIYATVLDDWLGVNSEATLGGRFERLAFLRS